MPHGTTLSANDKILDRTIRHQVFLERFKNGEARRIVDLINRELVPEIRQRLAGRIDRIKSRGYDSGPFTTKQYREMLRGLRSAVRRTIRTARDSLGQTLGELAVDEGRWTKSMIEGVTRGVGLDFQLPSLPDLRAVVREPIFDQKLADWFRGIERDTQLRMEREVNRGFLVGETTEDITRRLLGRRGVAGALATTRAQAAVVTRTAVNQISNRAREISFQENKDLVEGVQWVATLDSRTSEICASLDGQVFKLGEGVRPPAHPNCRSTIVPVLKSWESLGIQDPGIPDAVRASLDGKVPARVTFPEWLKGKPEAFQNEVLGKARAALFRRGVPISRMIDPKTLRPLTLEEIRKLEGLGEPPPAEPVRPAREIRRELKRKLRPIQNRMDEQLREAEQLAVQRQKLPAGDQRDAIGVRRSELLRNREEGFIRMREEVERALRVPDPIHLSIDVTRRIAAKARASITPSTEEAAGFLRAITSQKMLPSAGESVGIRFVRLRDTQRRAFAIVTDGTIHLNRFHGPRAYVHEIAHHLEARSPRAIQRIRQFLAARIDGDLVRRGLPVPDASLSETAKWEHRRRYAQRLGVLVGRRYGSEEVAFKDRFLTPYIGKIYSWPPQYTEVLSMGAEQLYADAYSMIQKDPEWFDLVVDLLRGTV